MKLRLLALLATCLAFTGCATYSSGSSSTITDKRNGTVTVKTQHRDVSVPVDSAKELIGGAVEGTSGFLASPIGSTLVDVALGLVGLGVPVGGVAAARAVINSKRKAVAEERARQEQHRQQLDATWDESAAQSRADANLAALQALVASLAVAHPTAGRDPLPAASDSHAP